MRITEVDKSLTQSELDQLEVFADRLFAKVGIDVEFTRHFLDRVNDERNVKQITASELTRLFKQEYKRWGKPIAQMGPDSEAVLKDLATDVNIPFALRWDKENNELDLIAKTVMRKKNFKTSNKEFEVQSVDYSLDNIQHKKVFESIQQLNEAVQAAVLPVGLVAYQAYLYARYAKAAWWVAQGAGVGITTYAAYIVNNTADFGWFERKMAASALAAQELWDKSLNAVGLGKENTEVVNATSNTLNAEIVAGVEVLTNNALETNELSPETIEIINQSNAAANKMNQQFADGVDPSIIATTYINSLGVNTSGVEGAAEPNSAAGQTITQIASISPEVAQAIAAELEANYQEASGQRAAEIAAYQLTLVKAETAALLKRNEKVKNSDAKLIALATQIAKTQADDRATALSDKNLIALGQQVAQQNADNRATELSDKNLIALGTAYAKTQADLRATELSDKNLIALGQQVAQQNADDRATELSDKKLIALGTAYAKTQADLRATELSDKKLIALGQQVAQQNTTAAANAYQNNKIDDIIKKSDADAKAAADKLATTQANAYQNNKINDIATKSDADAKANRQTKASDAKLIALGQTIAKQNADIKSMAQTANSDAKLIALGQTIAKQNADDKSTAQTAASDAKLIAIGQAYADTIASDKANQTTAASDAKLIALAKSVADANNDVTIDIPTDVIGKNDVHATDREFIIPAVGVKTGDIAKVNTNTHTNTNNRSGKKKNKKLDWGIGDGDYWDTNLYKWTQKYGTFENQNLVKKYFMINEGGAMPGVGAIHIDEITPTLQALEKSIGVDLMNNVLGSVGKRQFSGDIDVALQIQPEELPAFIEELKKNPLVLDIAKSSVIMTKVKIMDFDESKSDGRPRTGFVQVDFMPGDPGWMKTYYHSPSETESKYKGVYRNIMIATLAAVHNRDQSDAKLDDGRAMEERRFMWSPTEGLLRVQRTPVPKKSGDGYTKKNKNETIDGPWKQPDEIAAQLGLDSGKDLNSFESLLAAVKKNWTKEKLQYVIDGFKQNNVVQDIGVPEELDDAS